MSNFQTIYEGNRMGGIGYHPQIDTGKGFTCDEGVYEVVLAIWQSGLKTISSCQNINESGTGIQQWYVPRLLVSFSHKDVNFLVDMCVGLKSHMKQTSGWSQSITVDNYYVPGDPFATLTWVGDLTPNILGFFNGINDKRRR